MSTAAGAAAAEPAASAASAAGADVGGGPTERASTGWIVKLSLAYLGINITWAGPGQVLMSPQVERLTSADAWGFFTDAKETNLAIIGFVTGIFAMISAPVWGALSDRTTSRWGRRTPWIALGLVLVTVTMVLTGFARSLPALLLSWTAFQIAINAMISPVAAAVPDHVPERQRGLVSGWYGLAYTLAVVVGTGLGTLATALWSGWAGITAGYLLCAAACAVAVVPFLLDRWERGAPVARAPRMTWAELRDCYRLDLRAHPDFGWAWITRFVVTLASSTALFYLYYYLQDRVGLVRDDAAAAGGGLRVSDGVLVLTAVYALATLGTVVVAGVVSDRMGRRKVFVAVSAVFIGAATLLLAFAPQFPVAVVAAVVLGLGTGVFTAVDFALVTEVLPDAEGSGRDLGIIHLAILLPNVLAPVVAAVMVTYLGGYTGLYLLSGALAVLGAVLVRNIHGAR